MPTTDQFAITSKATCPSVDALRQYLAGWIEDAQALQIEGHLQFCPLCDIAVKELDSKPETLLQSLQSTVGPPMIFSGSIDRVLAATEMESASAGENESPIQAALEKARKIVEVTARAGEEKARAAWQPTLKELGIYDLIKPLGRGGMGAVYLAVHRQLRKQVAIKLLPMMSGEDSDVRARFEREIRVVGKLNHPSIVAATDAGEIDGTQFLVMEYVPGLDLSRLARLIGRLSVADSCELIRQVALGLSCAHAEGVVHRDVKPSNLMLDESGRIRILDFGLAQLSVWDEASVDLTTVGQLMGTLDYMAPEQAELSGNVDYRADLYALGATLFRLLCGRPPLAAAPNQSPLEKLRLLANHRPPKLDTLCPEAPPELVNLVSSMLARNPSDRPASAAHVAEQLAPFADRSRLVELLEKAKQKAASAPDPLKKSLFGDIPARLPYAPASHAASVLAPQLSNINKGRRRNMRRLFIAAFLPLLILAGILIKLETSKGQLVIESEVDNVTVKLVKNGKPLDGLQISHGTTLTRLQADNYEIIIEGASDGLEIVNDKFTLRNGETVLAKIQQIPVSTEPSTEVSVLSATKNADLAPGSDPLAAMRYKLQALEVELRLQKTKLGSLHPRVIALVEEITIRKQQLEDYLSELARTREAQQKDQPLYDGKPLDHWLDMLGREKSAAGLKTAFEACTALATEENGEKIADVVLDVVPNLNGETNLEGDSTKAALKTDWAAEQLLRKTLPGSKYCIRWIKEFEGGDTKWRERLWKSFPPRSSASDVEHVEPFVAWAEKLLQQTLPEGLDVNKDTLRAADHLRNMISTNQELSTESFRTRVVGILTSSARLPMSWWLSQPLVYRTSESDREIWPSEFKVEVTRRAIEALEDDETPTSLVIQASIILANSTGQSAEQQQEIADAVNRRLESFANDPLAMSEMVQTADEFINFSVPTTDTQSPLYLAPVQIEVRRSYVREIPVIEHSLVLTLLNHSWKLDQGASAKPQLDHVFRATQGTFDRIQAQAMTVTALKENAGQRQRGSGRFSGPPIHLLWPDLQTEDNGAQVFNSSRPVNLNQLVTATLWGKYEPTEQDWLEYLILLHPVMTERVTQAVNELKATPAAETAPAEKTE